MQIKNTLWLCIVAVPLMGQADCDTDGYDVTTDCDDHDPSVYPGAVEACDGIDNNCDGVVDEGCASDRFEVGLEAGAQYDTTHVPWVVDSGANWVRLNFIVGAWAGTGDPGFLAAYDEIVDAYVSNGVKVYGLIGAESVKGGYDRNDPASFVEPLRQAAIDIAGHFGDRVEVFEIFNEPNDWAGGTSSQVTPYWFARFLEVVYEEKFYRGWDVSLISGPLFSHDQDTGRSYLEETYRNGMDHWAWDWFHQNAGTYPLDGIGYHIYVQQGTTDAARIRDGIEFNLSELWAGVLAGENYRGLEPAPSKRIWITEIGWPEAAVGESGRAANVATAFDVLDDDPHVRMAIWFTLRDFDGNAWGLIRSDFTPKQSWYAFLDVTAAH